MRKEKEHIQPKERVRKGKGRTRQKIWARKEKGQTRQKELRARKEKEKDPYEDPSTSNYATKVKVDVQSRWRAAKIKLVEVRDNSYLLIHQREQSGQLRL